MKNSAIKYIAMLFTAWLTLSASAQNFNRYMASEPQPKQPAVISPEAKQPLVREVNTTEPVPSVRDYEQTPRNISVSNGNYNVSATNGRYSYTGSNYLPAAQGKGGVLRGGSAGGGSFSGTFGNRLSGSTGNRMTVSVGMGGVTIKGSDAGSSDDDDDLKPSTGDGKDPFAGGEVPVPVGMTLLPLSLMLLMYAVFVVIRRKRSEME